MIWVVFGISFIIFLLLPPDSLDVNAGIMIITFFGLMAAGIIPAITLLVSSSFSNKYSISSLKKLHGEVVELTCMLISILAFIISGGVASIIMQFTTAETNPLSIINITLTAGLLDRAFQAGVLACFVVSLDRLRVVRLAFMKVLEEKYRAAEEEATRRIKENSSLSSARHSFRKDEKFGQVLEL